MPSTRFRIWVLLLLALSPVLALGRTLHFWAVTGSVLDVKMYRQIARDFTKQTGIDVEVTPLAWGNFATKYFAAMAAGLPPDIGVTNLGGPFDYGSVGGIVDLRSEFPNEIGRLESQFDPAVLKMFTIKNKLFGIPSDLSTLVMYYRTDTFQKLGLKPPQTWSELNAVIGALEAHGYRYYFGFTSGAQWALGIYTMPFGLPGFAFDTGGAPVVNWVNPKYQAGVLEALNLWHMHDSPGQDLGSRVQGMFRSDDPGTAVPLMLDIHTDYSQLPISVPEINGKWDVAPWPKADDGRPYNVMGGTSYVIFRQSTMKREAFRWLEYLNSLEVQRYIVLDHLNRADESSFTISPVKAMWAPSNDSFWARPELKSVRRLHDVLAKVVPTFSSVPSIHGSTEAARLESDLLDQMGSFIRDGIDEMAHKRGISRWQLVQDFGAGKFASEREAFEQSIRERLRAGYAAITPQAQDLLTTETARYDSHYGRIIGRLPELERQRNVLNVVELIAAAILLAALATVCSFRRTRKHLISYGFVAAPLILALTFVFVPAVVALYLSFTEYHPVLPLSTASWVGLKNYSDVIHSGDLAQALYKTTKYAVITVPIGIFLSLILAFLLNSNLRGERFWRFVYFSPMVTSVVSIALIFSQLFLDAKQGWLNALLLKLGLITDPVPFLKSDRTFLECVMVLAIWQGLAFTILVFLAGLQQIPAALFEAAAVDGAGPVKRFWNVAVPGLRPQVLFISVLGIIGAYQVFETIYTLANKSGDAGARFGPNDSALTMVPLIYHTGFETFEMGKSSAIAYILFILILGLTVVQFFFYRRKEA